MTKEEILEKSRKENKNGDERDKKVLSDAVKYSYAAMAVCSAFFAFIRSRQGFPAMDLPAVCCVSVCVNFLYRYGKTKERSSLVTALIMLACSVIFTILFFMGR